MSSHKQRFLREFDVPPWLFRRGLNPWPPFRGGGIKVLRVAPDFRAIDVRLRLGAQAREAAGAGDKYEAIFSVEIVDAQSSALAVVEKTLHVRRHRNRIDDTPPPAPHREAA